MRHLPLLFILSLFAGALSAQVLNDGINFELRMAEFYGNSDNDATSTDEQSMLITTILTDAGGSSDLGTACSVFDCHVPCTVAEDTEAGPWYFSWATDRNKDIQVDIRLHAWGDEGGSECTFDAGDIDELMALASDHFLSNSMIVNNRAPVQWHTDFGSNDGWLFPNDYLFNIKPTAIWRYKAGGDCSDPLDFGTILSGETKQHINTNRSVSGPILGQAAVGYTDVRVDLTWPSPEVYYSFNITEASMVSISTSNPGSNFDTYLWLASETCETIAFNDDEVPGSILTSVIETTLDPGTYVVYVEGYDTEQGDFELSISAEAVVGTNDIAPSLPINIGPNPTDGWVQITSTAPGQLGKVVIEVINLQGQILQRSDLQAGTSAIDLSSYPAGTYIVRVISAAGQMSKKIVKY